MRKTEANVSTNSSVSGHGEDGDECERLSEGGAEDVRDAKKKEADYESIIRVRVTIMVCVCFPFVLQKLPSCANTTRSYCIFYFHRLFSSVSSNMFPHSRLTYLPHGQLDATFCSPH